MNDPSQLPQQDPQLPDDPNQIMLLDVPQTWRETWAGMPAYEQKDLMPWQTIKIHFANRADRQAFGTLLGQKITDETRFVWHPKAEIAHLADKRYASTEKVNPRYPVYIISKGRWESRLTSKALEALGVPYKIVIEPQEYDRYAEVIAKEKILVLPFSNLGQGSIPARNWVWMHAADTNAERHWILDDNIDGFSRFHNNMKVPVADGTIFRAAEDFTDRFTNVGLSGFNYDFFAKRKNVIPPFTLNTRIYSCILIKNDLPFAWRGRYNEDTDLSLRVLKSGLCTILFNAFLACKMATMTMKGGNTDVLYQDDGRLKMAESLLEQHPDVVKIIQRWGRAQHYIHYRIFRNMKLIPKPGFTAPAEEANEYGMELHQLSPEP